MSSKLREALDKIGNISAYVAENCGNAETAKYMNDIISIVQAALAEPVRNCDKFNNVDVAYNMFMQYVMRENPSFTKISPLHTVWDVLNWVLSDNKKGGVQ